MYPEKPCRLWVVILFKMLFSELFITLSILHSIHFLANITTRMCQVICYLIMDVILQEWGVYTAPNNVRTQNIIYHYGSGTVGLIKLD